MNVPFLCSRTGCQSLSFCPSPQCDFLYSFIRKMNTEMETHPILVKQLRISVEVSAVDDQHQQAEMEASPQNRRQMCNELVYQLCLGIPTAITSDRILLTAHKMYAYLAPGFRKKLIYRDAIAFLKTLVNANKTVVIRIDGMAQNNEIKPFAVHSKEEKFELETCHLRIQVWIWTVNYYRNRIYIYDHDDQLECAHLLYFLRLIAPLLQPIHLDFAISCKPIEHFMPFLSTLSGYIRSIGLSAEHFNSTLADEALGKYDELIIARPRRSSISLNAPKLVHWLSIPTKNGQPEKYFGMLSYRMTDLTLFLDEVKKDFARATSKRQFVVRLILLQPLDEFTMCNELTGEKLQMRRTNPNAGLIFYALTRFPGNQLENADNNCAEFGLDGDDNFVVLNNRHYSLFYVL